MLIGLERRMGTGGMGEEFPKEAGSVLVLKGKEELGGEAMRKGRHARLPGRPAQNTWLWDAGRHGQGLP